MTPAADYSATPLEAPMAIASHPRRLTLGLPAPGPSNPVERRFPLTPEAVEILVERGYTVKIERGASETIHYTDNRYSRHGAAVTDRASTLRCDIVIMLAPPTVGDIASMRRGAMLLTLMPHPEAFSPALVKALMNQGILSVAVNLIKDREGHTPFADILSEIDGRAAVAAAASMLADPHRGKGILLGGIAGIVPCEVMILGSGIAARAAALSALGLGAQVRMFDNDIYRLRSALHRLGPGVAGSAPHPHVIDNALRSADVIILSDPLPGLILGSDRVDLTKRGVIIFDLTSRPGATFPSLPTVDLTMASMTATHGETSRVACINAGAMVPRTVAMALSNTFITMLAELEACDGTSNALSLTPGLQCATLTFGGHAVNPDIARLAGTRPTDLALFIQLS